MAKGGKLVMDRAIIAGDPSLGEIVYCYQSFLFIMVHINTIS